MIRTKIIVTLGPASSSVQTLIRLFEEGADICRLNFSHGSLADHRQMLKNIRQAARHVKEPIAVLGDLCGPKIRLGEIANPDGMPINSGDILCIQRDPIAGQDLRVSTTYPRFVDDVRVGDRILIEDGLLRFLATDKTADQITCSCTSGGILRSSKGINLPNTPVSIPSITDKDWECADFAIDNDFDYLALSFVRHARDLLTLRAHLQKRKSHIGLIAKIEKAEAIQEIDAIIDAADGLMVARGDLGVEMDLARVPIIQKGLIRRCQKASKPVIVATQMLQSMIIESSPTRAEVSDVANAIFDGTDAIMLSGETSVGKYPSAAVHVMNHIAAVTETYLDTIDHPIHPSVLDKTSALSSAVAAGVWEMVQEIKAKLVVLWSHSGATARVFSKFRFSVPVVAFTNEERTRRQMILHYGVIPRPMSPPDSMKELIAKVDAAVRDQGFASESDRIVIVAGPSMGVPGTANQVIIHTVGMETP
ncbi:MAG: pyruvate kinase [Planctomycetota bacterium]|nr:pyruvate kinase [Planctomycetota bacterium]